MNHLSMRFLVDREVIGTVKVRSVFFALYRDILGTEEVEIELPEGSKLSDLIEIVRAAAGGERLPDALVTAVNREYASGETVLSDGDEIAFIPPVAGG